MRHIIVGTAGHIDHGKSALVKALTGIDPDRLKEEKERGITIDLGFAHLEIDGMQIGFVDVPGHEKFVKNMLAGVGGIDVVLMVVAADESVMPQTREHFDICRLLGVRAGIVAITKIDTVEPDLVELVRDEIREAFRGSFLENAPTVAVSARTGEGLERLKQALRQIGASVPQRPADRVFRLPIDRSFTIKGFGTVVTGTLIAGSLRKESEVELIPGDLATRVRGIQVHGRPADSAVAGQRTAVNLQGVELAQVKRGMVMTVPRVYRATRIVDARMTLLPGARSLKNLAKVRFHQGTSEVLARVVLLGKEALAPGETAYAQLRLDSEVFCLHGDAFIIRQFSPTVTIGGGRILNPHPVKHRTRDTAAVQILQELDGDDLPRIIPALIAAHPASALTLQELRSYVDFPEGDLQQACTRLAAAKTICAIPGPSPILAARTVIEALERETLARIADFHKEFPLLRGISREELRKRVFDRMPPEVFRFCLEDLAARKMVALQEDTVSAFGREVRLSARELELQKRIEEIFRRSGYQPPFFQEILAGLGGDAEEVRKIYHWMLKERILIRITEDLAYHRDTLEEIKARIRKHLKPGSRFGVPAFKELFDLTRKHAIPLLEYLDRERFTRREGNDRVLL